MDQPSSPGAARRFTKTATLAMAVTGALAAGMVTAPPEPAVADPVAISGASALGSNGWTSVDGYPWASALTLNEAPATAYASYYTTLAEHAELATTLGTTAAPVFRTGGKVAAHWAPVAARSAPVGVRIVAASYTTASTSDIGARVVAAASRLKGRPYRYGAAGPYAFDCSGFTLYVYRQFGVYLPHKANLQRYYGRAVSRAYARPGDLIVFLRSGYGYHAGIYAGGGYMWDSPHSGGYVGLHKVWSTNVVFRRLV